MATTISLSYPPAHVMLDSTLRDGEQSPGVAISPEDKADYVRHAEDAGVRYIEVGFPQNIFDYAACKAAAAASRRARIVGMALTTEDSIKKVADIGAHEVLLIVPSSSSHLLSVFGGPIEQLLNCLSKSIDFARRCGLLVNVGLEDASQGDMDIIFRLLDEVRHHDGGVDCITIADTRGQLLPTETANLLASIRARLEGYQCRLAFHAHDDLGLATANSLIALSSEQSLDCVHVTSCGFGERAGNASLEQIAVILETKLRQKTGIDLVKLRNLADFVQRIFLTPVHPHAPIVGSKVFLHESGIHQKGMLREKNSYQFLDPETFGMTAGFILGKHSGGRLRKFIAERAGCDENEVLGLQRSIVQTRREHIEEKFSEAVRILAEEAFIGMSCEKAEEVLKKLVE